MASATPFEKMEGIVQGIFNAAGGGEHKASVEHEPGSFSRGDQEEKCT